MSEKDKAGGRTVIDVDEEEELLVVEEVPEESVLVVEEVPEESAASEAESTTRKRRRNPKRFLVELANLLRTWMRWEEHDIC